MKGVALEKPFRSQKQALDHTVSVDGFIGIVGTTWCKPAVIAQQGRDEPFVGFDQKKNCFFHQGYQFWLMDFRAVM